MTLYSIDSSSSDPGLIESMGSGFKMLGLVLVIVIVFAKVYYLLEKYYYNDNDNPYKDMTLGQFYIYSFDNMVFNNTNTTYMSRIQQMIMLLIIFAFLD